MVKPFKSLSHKGIFLIVMTSSIIAFVITLVAAVIDYREEIDHLHKISQQIKATHLKPIASAVWNYDDDLLEDQIAGLLELRDINSIHIYDVKEKLIFDKNSKDMIADYVFTEDFKLKNDFDEEIGSIVIEFTTYHIYRALIRKNIIFIMLQFLKTICVSFVIFMIFENFMTRHIKRLSKFLENFDILNESQDFHFSFQRSKHIPDEFDVLEEKINNIFSIISDYKEKNESRIRRQEEKALQNSKMASLGEMAAGIAHEVNNPLTVLLMRAYQGRHILQKNKDIDVEKMIRFFDIIESTGLRIQKIVEGLKFFSREGSRDSFKYERVEIIIRETLVLCEEKFKQKQVVLHIQSIPQDKMFYCQPVQISQVLLNLLNNAFQECKDKKEKWVDISYDEDEDFMYLKVTDSGKGISKEIVAKIFEPFFTTKEVGVGTGLGLSLSKGIMQEHQGDLYVEDQSKNTVFVIKLPKNHKPELQGKPG